MVLWKGATAAAGVGGLRLTLTCERNSAVESWRSFLLTSACSFGSWDDGAAFRLGTDAGSAKSAVLCLVSRDSSDLAVFPPIHSLSMRISFSVSVSCALEPLSEI